ncbi:MAG: hypothetical protein N3A69_06205, partial [Leptospiraceae bacterium]|nr:hypothetical protein [Leptospiraceae bacterium]
MQLSKKKLFKLFLVFWLILSLTYCKKEVPTEAVFLVNQCFQCHYPENTREIAPSFPEIKATYLSKYPTEQEFIASMISYIQDPKPENMLDPTWQSRYRVMPTFSYKTEELEKTVKFIYKTDFN